jgi:hypothetical protein
MEALPHMTLHPIPSEFFIYEENSFSFYQCGHCQLRLLSLSQRQLYCSFVVNNVFFSSLSCAFFFLQIMFIFWGSLSLRKGIVYRILKIMQDRSAFLTSCYKQEKADFYLFTLFPCCPEFFVRDLGQKLVFFFRRDVNKVGV